MTVQLTATVVKADDRHQLALSEALAAQVDHEAGLHPDAQEEAHALMNAAIGAAVRLVNAVGRPGGRVSAVIGGNPEPGYGPPMMASVSVIVLTDPLDDPQATKD